MGGIDHLILGLVLYTILINLIVICSKALMVMILLAAIIAGLAIRQQGVDRVDYSLHIYRFGCRYMESEKVLHWMQRFYLCDDTFMRNVVKKAE